MQKCGGCMAFIDGYCYYYYYAYYDDYYYCSYYYYYDDYCVRLGYR